MEFVNVKEWKIPVNGVNKDVIRVTDSQGRIIWKKTQPQTNEYFHFKTRNYSSKIELIPSGNVTSINLEYSKDKINWYTWTKDSVQTGVRSYTLNPNSTLYIRGDNNRLSSGSYDFYTFAASNIVECHGNIMSLLDKTMQLKTISYGYCFYKLFYNTTNLVTPPELPATTLSGACYENMFYRTSIEYAPELPATTLATQCYRFLFSGCKKITSAPDLIATTLPERCYQGMFIGCTSLVESRIYAENESNLSRFHMFYNSTATNAVLHVTNNLIWDSSEERGEVGSNWTIVNDL